MSTAWQTGANYIRAQLKKVGIAVDLRPAADFPELGAAHRLLGLPAHHEQPLDLSRSGHRRAPHLPMRQHQEDGLVEPRRDIATSAWTRCSARRNRPIDVPTRKALYAEFQHIVNRDLPLYFINEEPYVTVSRRYVMDLPETVWGPMQPMDRVWLDR